MRKRAGFDWILCFVAVLIVTSMTAQDDCEFVPEGKVLKLLEKADNKRKYDSDNRFEFLTDALDEDDNCLPCLQKLGVSLFKRSKRSGGSFGPSETYLLRLVEKCPEYHSEPYYYLGAINYAAGDYKQAELYFEKFVHFPDDDPSKFGRDYDKKYDIVLETLPNIRFWKEFYDSDFDFEPEMVTGVSSDVDEYIPCLSPDGEVMFYTRRTARKAKGDLYTKTVEEFTWSIRDDINSPFDDGKALPAPFNLGNNCGGATIAVNNKELYVTIKNPVAENKDNMDIYRTHYELIFDESLAKNVYKWSDLELLGDHINGDRSWDAQPSLSGDGQTLFFATIRPGCIERGVEDYSSDLFYCTRNSDDSWSAAQSLGPVINTSGEEKAPYMHSDSKSLYFISSGHKGRGGYDIFYSRMNDDGSWSTPKNMGHPINTEEDEIGVIVSADGEVGYFVSRGQKGSRSLDVFSFAMPLKAKPDKVMILKGQVKNEEGDPVTNARVKLTYAQSKEVQEIEVSTDDGKYATIVNLARGEDVLMSVEAEGVAFNSRIVAKKDDKNPPAVVKLEVETKEIVVNKPFVINDIFYGTNSASIDPISQLILDQFAAYLAENSGMHVEIRGHTDDVGSEKDNLALSMDRAFEVKGFLEKQGVPGNHVTAKGYGESSPVAENTNEVGRSKNRRTEFVIKKW